MLLGLPLSHDRYAVNRGDHKLIIDSEPADFYAAGATVAIIRLCNIALASCSEGIGGHRSN